MTPRRGSRCPTRSGSRRCGRNGKKAGRSRCRVGHSPPCGPRPGEPPVEMQRDVPPPDFIGIGAQKAGTTWLGHNLQLHPEIWMPGIKELHYFNERINDPRNPVSRLYGKMTGQGAVSQRWRRQVRKRLRRQWKRPSLQEFLWELRYYAGTPGDGWYASLFAPGRVKVRGEITPAYPTLGPANIARVHDLLPE